ncbi:hypothetical protein ACHOLT_05600 [Desulfitobacterium sp. Sab5]|uniref:hypothetical protein n=1 Tax=Desulfitobacterium nosdiversum TaxID=3375356 RepID=UPI003CE791EF
MDNEIEVRDVITISNPIKVVFNGNEFDFLSIYHFYKYEKESIEENGTYKEIFPGIYYTPLPITPKGFLKKFLNIIKEKEIDPENIVSFKLIIENKRDFIQVYRNLSIDKYPKWDNSVTDEYELIYESGSEKGSAGYYYIDRFSRLNLSKKWDYDPGKESKYIKTTEIPLYPGSLRSGSGCVLENVFWKLNLLDIYNEKKYSLFQLEEILTVTASDERFLDICRSFKHCKELIEKMATNTYDINYPDYEQIHVTEYDGIYIAGEGKHRTCIAKRFGIPKIYAIVTKAISEQQKIEENLIQIQKPKYRYDFNTILNDCYNSFEHIGFNRNETRELLKEGVSGLQLIKRIEARQGRSLYELVTQLSHLGCANKTLI